MSFETVKVWTDGACIPNPGKGGWAWVTDTGKQAFGNENPSTNNRMEMMAIIEAIDSLANPKKVLVVHSDSLFVIQGITEWVPNWKKHGWTRRGKEIKNLVLWQVLDELVSCYPVSFKWVRGHSGDPYNELADRLSVEATGASEQEIELAKMFLQKPRLYKNIFI